MTGAAGEGHLRLSDAEREAAAADLGEHFAQGRLDAEEHAERLERVWAARTRAEIPPIFRDLPSPYAAARPTPGPVAAPRPPLAPRYWAGGIGPLRRGVPTPFVVVLGVLLAITVLTHLPFLLLGLLVWFFVAGRHRHHGPHGPHGPHGMRLRR